MVDLRNDWMSKRTFFVEMIEINEAGEASDKF
jgi:hypothetical protein